MDINIDVNFACSSNLYKHMVETKLSKKKKKKEI